MFDWSKLKAYADDKFKVDQLAKYVHNGLQNTVGKKKRKC